jgi:mycofactocin precursor
MTFIEASTGTEVDASTAAEPAATPEGAPQVEVLVEEISIDGMCGVY